MDFREKRRTKHGGNAKKMSERYMNKPRKKRSGSSTRSWKSALLAKSSPLEDEFLLMWRVCKGPNLEREFRFHPERKWKLDFAHPATLLAIELEGGVWSGGRHTNPAGFIKDCEKYNAATLLGWTVYRIPRDLLTTQYVNEIKTKHFGNEPYYGKETA